MHSDDFICRRKIVFKETNIWRWSRIHFVIKAHFFEIYHSETLFPGFALRWLSLQEENWFKENEYVEMEPNTFCNVCALFWDIPFRNFIPRVCTQMTLFAGRKNCFKGNEYVEMEPNTFCRLRIHFEYILWSTNTFCNQGALFWDILFRNFIPRVCTEMTLFAGGLKSVTLFTRKNRDGFICRGDQSFVE